MTKRLLLTIALGSTVAVIAAGAAGSAPIDLGGGAKVQVPTGGVLPACADLEDNDADGKTDLADVGCEGPLDRDEFNPPPAPAGGDTGSKPGDGGGGQLGPGAPGGTLDRDVLICDEVHPVAQRRDEAHVREAVVGEQPVGRDAAD